MGRHTGIEYADDSFNPWIGCSKVSPGCINCYAERSAPARVFKIQWGDGHQRRLGLDWNGPVRWNKNPWVCDDCGSDLNETEKNEPTHEWATKHGTVEECCGPVHRRRVMVSLCDWLDPKVDVQWLARFLSLIKSTPNLLWLLPTKRIYCWPIRSNAVLELWGSWARSGRFGVWDAAAACAEWLDAWKSGSPPSNVAVGVSVENQMAADVRIPALIKMPARWRWVSAEPLLGPIDFTSVRFPNGSYENVLRTEVLEFAKPIIGKLNGIDWVAVGGESGSKSVVARPCNVEWIFSIVHQGEVAGVPIYVKQLGSRPAMTVPDATGQLLSLPFRLKHPKGGDPAEWPEDLRVQEFIRDE